MFGRQEPFLEQNQTHCQGTPQGHICQALSLRQIENNLTRKSTWLALPTGSFVSKQARKTETRQPNKCASSPTLHTWAHQRTKDGSLADEPARQDNDRQD